MVKVIATVNVPNESSWCGEYAEGTVYKTGAIVSYEGNVYLCIKDLDEMQDPTNTEYWEMLNEESGGTVEVIPDGYIKPSGTIDITENKTVDVTRYASAKINVPIPSGYVKPSGTLPITENGLHTVRKADGGYYDSVNVNVPSVEPTLITPPTITENGTYIANNYNADGFSSVTVNVPTEAAEEIPDHTDSDFELHYFNKGSGELGVSYSSTEKVSVKAAPDGAELGSFYDPNFVPKHIEKGVTIFGVTGEFEGSTDSPLPIEVSTEAEMTALLTNGTVGGVYKYTGTTGTYENGALYVLEVDI